MITISKGDVVELVNLKKQDGSDYMFLKTMQVIETSIPAEELPPAGQFKIEGDGNVAVAPELVMSFTALHTGTLMENEVGGIAFDSDGSVWTATA